MDLEPGEKLLMDSGKFPISYQGDGITLNGRLYLTDRRLIFEPGRFQSVVGSAFLSVKDKESGGVEIPLSEISGVEKGFMAHIKIKAREKAYSFKGMRKADDWVKAIEMAISPQPLRAEEIKSSETETNTRIHYCPYCGAPIHPGDVYCGNCGRKLPLMD